ncbi:MAG: hypothetical protein LUD72_11610 [Bacteroidales bacterium]|nr:hypothetical protein [Bacteroidales bacterium]
MKKHRFAFIYKYIILAATLACVLCFAFVFARYVTGTYTGVTADIASFDVVAEILSFDTDSGESSDGNETSNGIKSEEGEDSDDGQTVSVDSAVYIMITNNGDVAVNYMIELVASICEISVAYEVQTTGDDGVPNCENELTVTNGNTVSGGSSIDSCGGVKYVALVIRFTCVNAVDHLDQNQPDNTHPETTNIYNDFTLTFSYEQASDL